MARQKETKPRAKLASRWDIWSGDKPQSYELPEGAVLQMAELDPDEEIPCADCGKKVPFQYAHASPTIRHRRKTYISYLVCGACYFREKDEHRQIMEKLMAAKG